MGKQRTTEGFERARDVVPAEQAAVAGFERDGPCPQRARVLALQRLAGNHATTRWIARQPHPQPLPAPSVPPLREPTLGGTAVPDARGAQLRYPTSDGLAAMAEIGRRFDADAEQELLARAALAAATTGHSTIVIAARPGGAGASLAGGDGAPGPEGLGPRAPRPGEVTTAEETVAGGGRGQQAPPARAAIAHAFSAQDTQAQVQYGFALGVDLAQALAGGGITLAPMHQFILDGALIYHGSDPRTPAGAGFEQHFQLQLTEDPINGMRRSVQGNLQQTLVSNALDRAGIVQLAGFVQESIGSGFDSAGQSRAMAGVAGGVQVQATLRVSDTFSVQLVAQAGLGVQEVGGQVQAPAQGAIGAGIVY